MPKILSTKSLYYNDVNLVMTGDGQVPTRSKVPNELYRCIVAGMPSVVGTTFAREAAKNGLSIMIPRRSPKYTDEYRIAVYNAFQTYKLNNDQLCLMCMGLDELKETFLKLSPLYCSDWCLDIANGGVPQLEDRVKHLQSNVFDTINLMVGNIMYGEHFVAKTLQLQECGERLLIRVGIAGGSPCATSDVTGYNRGQITEISECYNSRKDILYDCPSTRRAFICADGGIAKEGYAAKAFGAGADYCIMGGFFSRAVEAETHITGDGEYWGCASDKQIQISQQDKVSEGKSFEIKEELVPLAKLCKDLQGGLASAVSYSGYDTLSKFIGNGVFEVKQNSLPPRKRN